MNKFFKSILRTAGISYLLSVAINMLYYAIRVQPASSDYGHVMPLALVGAVYLNIILFIMSLPVLFLNDPKFMRNTAMRLILYFSGPVAFLIGVLSAGLQERDFEFYIITAVIYLIVHSVSYKKLVAKTV